MNYLIFKNHLYEYVELDNSLINISNEMFDFIISDDGINGGNENVEKSFSFLYKGKEYNLLLYVENKEIYNGSNIIGFNNEGIIKIRLYGISNLKTEKELIAFLNYLKNIIRHELIHIVNKKQIHKGEPSGYEDYITNYSEQDSVIVPLAREIALKYKEGFGNISEIINEYFNNEYWSVTLKLYNKNKKLWNKFLKEIYKYVDRD